MAFVDKFSQLFFSGLATGCIYAFVALGYVLCYNVSGVLNFAQGELIAYGGLVTAALVSLGVPLILAVLSAVTVGTAIGVLQEKLTVAPISSAPGYIRITVALAVAVILRGVALIVFGKDPLSMPPFTGEELGGFMFLRAILPWQVLWVWGLSILFLSGVFYFLRYTPGGRAVRAVSINLLAANIMGINAQRTRTMVYGAVGAISALGGATITPMILASWSSGVDIGLKGFVGMIIGNLVNPGMAVLGGLGVGVLEQMSAGFISSGYRDVVVYVFLLLFLMIRGGVFARGREDILSHGGH
jgi:branched-subunit amino acid ABC-type transport system permease component